jgi:hypothetical protein
VEYRGTSLIRKSPLLGPYACGIIYRRVNGLSTCGLFKKSLSTLEATQGPIDGVFGQLPLKCHLEEEVAFVGD